MPITLWPYQRDAVDAVRAAWRGGMRAPALAIPTGGGKTTVFTWLAEEFVQATGRRVLEIAHRKELIEQAAQRQRDMSGPGRTVGIVKAHQNETLAEIVVGSVQTLANPRRLRQLLNVGLIIVDECHHATAPSYRMILDAFPDALVLGVTATFTRGDGAALGQVFQDVVYRVPISLLQAQGYLCYAKGYRVGVGDLDLSKVRTTGGEYRDGELDAALSNSQAPRAIVEAVQQHAPDDAAVVFTPGVHFAQVMDEAFRAAGFTSAWVSGETPDEERSRIVKGIKEGEIQIINNCGVFTEGTDIPRLKTCVLKPTRSGGLYTQMAGRVLRPWGGRLATILDPVGVTAMHSLEARVDLFGAEAAELLEREPCDHAGGEPCSCGRRPCGEQCVCGGGAADECWCDRPAKRETKELVLDEEPVPEGELVSVEVDLFHLSKNQWLVTHGGTWFLSAGQRFIALVPGRRRGEWSVCAMSRSAGGGSRYILRDIPDKGYAMQWSEDHVTLAERRTARKDRSWRARNLTQQQLQDARDWAVAVPEGASGGQVADLIAIEQASRRIDAGVEQLKARQA